MSGDSTTNSGQTNLFEAIQQRFNQSVVCELISACPDVNITGGYNSRTALFGAVTTSNYESVVRALIDAGADVNKTDNEGETALLYLFQRLQNREEIGIRTVRALIDAGADVNKSDKYGYTALLYALQKSGSESLIFALLSAPGVDVNITDEYGKTALFYAVQQSNNESVVQTLINAGADVNRTDNDGRTALFFSCGESTNEGVVRALIDAGADVNITDKRGETALFYAVQQSNNESVVQTLIDAGAYVNTIDNEGKTALFSAVRRRNNKRVVCKLIDSGADINTSDNKGKTALFYALETHDNERVVRELIDAGTDLNITDNDGRTILLQAIQNRYDESVIFLLIGAKADVNITDNEGKTALFHALQQGNNEDMVRKLIDAGADVNKTNAYGETALCYAVYYANESVVSTLIDAGADVNITDDSRKTQLFRAIECYSGNVLRTLIKAGVDVNKTDESGNTALFYALKSRGGEDVVCTLIAGGADVNKTDQDSRTALFYAVCEDSVRYSDNESVVHALIGAGAKVDVTDRYGKTPLIYAIQESNNENVVLALINASTDLNKADYFGHTVLFYAVQRRNNENIVKALLDAGSDVKKTDKYGQTALFYAVQQRNNENVVRALVDADNDILNIRDIYGRTAMLYVDYKSPKTFAYLLEKGGKRCLQLKDNCNVNIVTLVIEDYLSKTGMFMEDNDPEVLGELPKQGLAEREGVAKEIINIMFRKYISDVLNCHSIETKAAPQNLKTFKGLAKLYKDYVDNNVWQRKEKMESLIKLLEQEFRNTTKILEILIELGADPDSADSDGNTALHYATRLPLSSASQELVMDVCRHLKELQVRFNPRNHQDQTPLLFGLAFDTPHMTESVLQSVVNVCIFLLNNGSSIEETSRTGVSVFHLIIKLFQEGLKLHRKAREEVLRDLIRLLQRFPTSKVTVNNLDNNLNSPLHLWASLTLPSPSDYSSRLADDYTFKNILQLIFDILLECGAKLNPRNENEATPLHLCKTWTAVKLLIDAGAITNDLNSSKRSPLLVAAKEKTYLEKPSCFYPDVADDPQTFWKSALEGGLDPWTADQQGESVLGILVESEAFLLAKALIDVGIELNHMQSDTKLALLCIICKDKSTHTHWKTNLVEVILNSAIKSRLPVDSALRLCCRNIVKYGVLDDEAAKNQKNVQRETKEEPNDDDGQPPNKKRKKEEEKEESNDDPVTFDSVHCTIAKKLLLYGVDIKIRGSSGESCLDIAENCPALKDLLMKPIDIDSVLLLIPWTSISSRYKRVIAKVARRQECQIVEQIWYHRDHIGSGSFGHIFAGINEKDGREVAIKRIEIVRLQRPEDEREIQNLTALADCQQVVRYVSFFEDQDFCYVVLELMEGNLEEYLNESTIDASEATILCKDVVMGLKFLHEQNILHRDLKPQNILYKTHPKLCLKIADFGLSRRIDSITTTVYGTNAGTRCWIAPEVLNSSMDHSKSSDIFSCGLLLHYILSRKKHPFSPVDWATDEIKLRDVHETEDNLMKGKMEGWDNSLSPEASHLVRKMIASTVKNRPTAEEAIDHPLFWTKEKKIDFLEAVGNQTEFVCPRARRSLPLTAVETDLENSFGTIVKYGSWTDPGYLEMQAIYTGMTTSGKGRKSYDESSVVELVRFIRNVYEHFQEKTISTTVPIEDLLHKNFVILEYFPALVMEVYKAVTTHGWDQTRDEIKYAMNK